MSNDAVRAIVNSEINNFAQEQVSVYKFYANQRDIYSAEPTYAPAVIVTGVYVPSVDKDQWSWIGAVSEDSAFFTFAPLELETKFPDLARDKWITKKDQLELDGTRYTIVGVHPTGRLYGRSQVIVIHCMETTDEIVVYG